MASIGTLSIASATDFTASKTFTGTAAADDYFDFTGTVSPLFTELYPNAQGDLIYNVVAPTINKSAVYTISFANAATAVEAYLRAGVTTDAYNGLSIFGAPGDYSTQTAGYSLYGTAGNDTTIAPLNSTKATGLQGWMGDDTLIGGNTENTISAGPGNNQMSGKKGADVYRTKTSYLSNDVILDDGDDLAIDVLQVLLNTTTDWYWTFEKIANDLKIVITDASSRYNLTVKDQYVSPTSGLEAVSLYSMNVTGGFWRSAALKAQNASTLGYTTLIDAGTAGGDQFDPVASGMGSEKLFYRAFGNSGNDSLKRIDNKDIYTFFDGGDGIDTISYARARADYTVTEYSQTSTLRGISVKDNRSAATVSADGIVKVERFIFSDKKLAFDTSGNAGNVAKILGSVFGKTAVTNKEYVGIGLSLLDSGMSYSGLAAMAISASGVKDADSIVERLYTNVIGTKPTTIEKAPFVQMLNGGMSSADLVVMAADTSINQTNIGLTGLATTGIEYQ